MIVKTSKKPRTVAIARILRLNHTPQKNKTRGKRMKKEKIENQNSLFHYIKQKKGTFCVLVITYFLIMCARVAATFVAALALNAIGAGNFDDIIAYATIEFTIKIGLQMLNALAYYCCAIMQAHCTMEIQKSCNNKMFEISSPTYSSANSGVFMNRIANKPLQAFKLLDFVMNGTVFILMDIAVVGYIAFSNWVLGLIVVGILALTTLIIYVHNKIQAKVFTEFDEKDNNFSSAIIESIRGARDVKCLSLQDSVKAEIVQNNAKYTKSANKLNIAMESVEMFERIFTLIVSILLIYVGMILYEDSFITMLALVYIVTNYEQVQEFMYDVIYVFDQTKRYKMEMARIFQLSNENIFKIEHFGTQDLVNPQGKIEFKNVHAEYKLLPLNAIANADLEPNKKKKAKLLEEIKREQEKPVKSTLNGVSFTIEPNTRVAIVGKSGGGKTTIVSLLNRLIDPTSGEILIDDINVRDLSRDALRNTVTIVNQFPYVYDMSIKDNLKLAKPDATDDEIADVVKRAALNEFIDRLPYKLDTIIGENGVKLSGGQKQRLAIARALLKDTKIIVFDESTSSLDNFAQKHVQESIDNLHDKTVIIIAHRLSTIIDCDKIIFIDDGQVKAVGTFNQLMSDCKEFSDLYAFSGGAK